MPTLPEVRRMIGDVLGNAVAQNPVLVANWTPIVMVDRPRRVILALVGELDAPADIRDEALHVLTQACLAMDCVVVTGPAWPRGETQCTPLRLMPRHQLEDVMGIVETQAIAAARDVSIARLLGMQVDAMIEFWRGWTEIVNREFELRKCFGEPEDPILETATIECTEHSDPWIVTPPWHNRSGVECSNCRAIIAGFEPVSREEQRLGRDRMCRRCLFYYRTNRTATPGVASSALQSLPRGMICVECRQPTHPLNEECPIVMYRRQLLGR